MDNIQPLVALGDAELYVHMQEYSYYATISILLRSLSKPVHRYHISCRLFGLALSSWLQSEYLVQLLEYHH